MKVYSNIISKLRVKRMTRAQPLEDQMDWSHEAQVYLRSFCHPSRLLCPGWPWCVIGVCTCVCVWVWKDLSTNKVENLKCAKPKPCEGLWLYDNKRKEKLDLERRGRPTPRLLGSISLAQGHYDCWDDCFSSCTVPLAVSIHLQCTRGSLCSQHWFRIYFLTVMTKPLLRVFSHLVSCCWRVL